MPVHLNSGFFDRCGRQHRETLESGAEGPYRPELILGDYARQPFCPSAEGKGKLLMPFIEHCIERALRQRPDDRVGAFDSAGALGLSWLRLAKRFRHEVRDGRLLLAVSSMDGDPVKYLEAACYYAATGVNNAADITTLQEANQLLQEHGGDVLYAAAHPALNDRLQVSDLTTASFDIVHERRGGVVWSRVPGSHMLLLGGLVADTGYLLLDRDDIGRAYAREEVPQWEREARLADVRAAGNALLTHYGLSLTAKIEAGPEAGAPLEYLIFSGSQAEPVSVG